MDYKTITKNVKNGKVLPVYLCFGTENFLMHEFIENIQEQLIQPEHQDFAVNKIDLAETPLDAVIEDAETLPFLVPRKLIIAQDAQFFTSAKENNKVEHRLDRLVAYLKSPVDYTVILFTVHAEKLDERKKIVKMMKDMGAVVAFQTLSAAELTLWVKDQAMKRHCSFADGAVQDLILYAGTDLQNLETEIEKCSLFVGNGGVVTQVIVDQLTVRSMEQNVFMLIEEIVHLRLEKALDILYELLKQKEEPIKILMLMARQFRIMLQVKELSRRGFTQQQMASQIGLHPYAVKLAEQQSRQYGPEKLNRILAQLADLDYQMKSGKIEKVLGLEMFLLKLSAA